MTSEKRLFQHPANQGAMLDSDRSELEAAIGHRFQAPDLLERALTHRSHSASLNGTRPEAEHRRGDNEKLEFLGDAVLGLVVSEYVWETFPDWDEGRLSKSVARLVSERALARAAGKIGLGRFLKLGPGEEKTGGREKPSLLADAYEAILAAVYLDGGLQSAADFARRTLLDEEVRRLADRLSLPDHKSALQEHLQQHGLGPAEYRVLGESGPDHRKTFQVEVLVQGRRVATGEGSNKKEAEQAAARVALEEFRSAPTRAAPIRQAPFGSAQGKQGRRRGEPGEDATDGSASLTIK